MDYFKVGCRWSAEGRKETNIEDVFQKYQAIFIDQKTHDSSRNPMNLAKINDRVAIADGYNIIGVAIIKSYEMSLNQMNIPKEIQEEDPHKFEHHIHANYQQSGAENALGFRALVMLFRDDTDFIPPYEKRGAFCSVADQSVKDHIDAMCEKYNMLPK